MKAIAASSLKDIGNMYKDFDVIGIDEGQFFPDVSPPLLIFLGRRMVRPGSQRGQSGDHLGTRRHLPADRLRVHPAADPQGREGEETSSDLQRL
jgi:hypothetical protein